jgi:hypothetical protein
MEEGSMALDGWKEGDFQHNCRSFNSPQAMMQPAAVPLLRKRVVPAASGSFCDILGNFLHSFYRNVGFVKALPLMFSELF